VPIERINGLRLRYEVSGEGAIPLVMVHGSWGSHHAWDLVVPALSERFRVVTFDRRGHSESERPPGQGSIREDAADVVALIEHLGLAPAWVAGTSFGAAITLHVAASRSDVLRGIACHEPPLMGLLGENRELSPTGTGPQEKIAKVIARIAAGDDAGAAEEFVEEIAFGPGHWARFPEATRRTFIENAPTFLDESRDPEQLTFDLATLKRYTKPTLLTLGSASPPMFEPVVKIFAAAMPQAEVVTIPGAGHGPHNSHPAEYVEALTAFISNAEA
jgi:pimeloyl-ACP methyl ester carboxylesterase